MEKIARSLEKHERDLYAFAPHKNVQFPHSHKKDTPLGVPFLCERVTKSLRIEVRVSKSSVYYLAFFSFSLISCSEYVLSQAAHKNSVQINLMFPII